MAELQQRMSYAEFVDWCAFDSVEPLGEKRADLRNAQLLATLININREPNSQAHRVEEFLFDYWDERPVLDGRSIMQKFMMLAGQPPRADSINE